MASSSQPIAVGGRVKGRHVVASLFNRRFSGASAPTAPVLALQVVAAPSPTIPPDPATAGSTLTQSTVEPDLWLEAYQKADERTRKWIGKLSPSHDDAAHVKELVALVRKREQEYKNTTPKIKVGDREIIWRDHADRVVAWMTAIGDIAVQFAPAPCSAIWAALKVLLEANVSQCEDLVAIFGCAERVLRLVRRGKVYVSVYIVGAGANIATEDLRKAIVDLYRKALELLANAGKLFEEGWGKKFLRALVDPVQGEQLVSDLSRLEQDLTAASQACGAVLAAENKALLQSLDTPLRHVDDGIRELLENIDEAQLREALEYISPIRFGNHHQSKHDARTLGTCEWLLKHPIFLEWEESSSSSILWLRGQMGAGKSYLASRVIDRYRVDPGLSGDRERKCDEGFAFFYCNQEDPALQEPQSILRSYVRQLATLPRYPQKVQTRVLEHYRVAHKLGKALSLDDCKQALSELLDVYPRTILVLDALDECDKWSRDSLIRILATLVKEANRPVKLFVSSRKEGDIEKLLPWKSLIEITPEHSGADIEKYIDEEVAKMDLGWASISPEVRRQVKTTICARSNGMFRWAYLQMQQLRDLQSEENIRARLGNLPEDLWAAYDELYHNNVGHDRTILERAAKWLMCADGSLSIGVLLPAVRLGVTIDDDGQEALEILSTLAESTLEHICRHLMIVEGKQWRFSHASVVDYFKRRWTRQDARSQVAHLSLLCLIEGFSKRPGFRAPKLWQLNQRDLEASFFGYILVTWAQLVPAVLSQQPGNMAVSRTLKRFLGSGGGGLHSSQQYRDWAMRHQDLRKYEPGLRILFDAKDLEPIDSPVFAICIFGLYNGLKDWWDEAIDVSQVNNAGLDLLAIAAKYGHEELCDAIIARGGNVNRRLSSVLGSALAEAVDRSQVGTMKLLLSNGADLNLGNVKPLCIAARGRDKSELVEMFLKAGADPNLQCGQGCDYGCPLEVVCHQGDLKLARLLIEYGANVNLNTTNGRFGSPLVAAAAGYTAVCDELLIKHGADVNARLECGLYGSPLAAAVAGSWGSVDRLRYLIEDDGGDATSASWRLPGDTWIHDEWEPWIDEDEAISWGWVPIQMRKDMAAFLMEKGVRKSVLIKMGFWEDDLQQD
ncbi:hypothetical protein BGZ61DRAFT_416922 [Ilyonectria robusta]|uniref:uncharacterized protein n=1 Tax=Ilyonectria robusta TaxID=1079257 RepID=UPI001E8EADC6|nr:uncharacterized protein BGZ61DRAFT_416922 [Ilyonectria robusta]KAH8722233.1 hypothetical protein BGZ61DRAFT_416922 [Ilyonectria robusta]